VPLRRTMLRPAGAVAHHGIVGSQKQRGSCILGMCVHVPLWCSTGGIFRLAKDMHSRTHQYSCHQRGVMANCNMLRSTALRPAPYPLFWRVHSMHVHAVMCNWQLYYGVCAPVVSGSSTLPAHCSTAVRQYPSDEHVTVVHCGMVFVCITGCWTALHCRVQGMTVLLCLQMDTSHSCASCLGSWTSEPMHA
jgi:hypothetical protein